MLPTRRVQQLVLDIETFNNRFARVTWVDYFGAKVYPYDTVT